MHASCAAALLLVAVCKGAHGADVQGAEACMPTRRLPRRYLRATGGDQKHAAKRVADTLAWRRAERPEHIVCTACRANHKSHYMQVRGWAAAGHFVCAAANRPRLRLAAAANAQLGGVQMGRLL